MTDEERKEFAALSAKVSEMEERLESFASSFGLNVMRPSADDGATAATERSVEPENGLGDMLRRLDEAEASVRELRGRLEEMDDDQDGDEDEPPPPAGDLGPRDAETPQVVIPDAVETASSSAPYSSTDWIKERGNVIEIYGFDGDDNGGTVEIVADADYASGTAGTASGTEQTGGTGAATSGDGSGDEPRNVRLHLTNPDGTWAPTPQWMIPVREDRDGIRTLRWCRLGGEVDFAATFSGNDAPYLLKVRLTEKTESSANVECYFPDSGSGDYPPSVAAAAPHVRIGGSYNNAPGTGWQRLGSVSAGSGGGRAYVVAVQSVDTSGAGGGLSTLARTSVEVYFFATQAAFDSWVVALPQMVPHTIYSIVAYVKLDTLSVVQCGMGPHSVQPAVTDTEASGSTFLSIDRPKAAQQGQQQQRPELAELQMHDFREPPSAGGFTVSIEGEWESGTTVTKTVVLTPPETPLGATYLFPVRRVTSQKTELVWVTLSASGSFEIPCDPTQGSGGDQIYNDLMDLDTPGLYGYEVTDGNSAVLVSLDGNWWKLGGDETECYGSAIGDPNQSQAINLSGRRLVGSGWGSDADFYVGGDLYCSGGVYVDASHYIHVAGDAYAPTQITVGGQTFTVLAKV